MFQPTQVESLSIRVERVVFGLGKDFQLSSSADNDKPRQALIFAGTYVYLHNSTRNRLSLRIFRLAHSL